MPSIVALYCFSVMTELPITVLYWNAGVEKVQEFRIRHNFGLRETPIILIWNGRHHFTPCCE